MLSCLAVFVCAIEARRVRVRPVAPRPIAHENDQYDNADEIETEDNSPQQAIQYYSAEPRPQPQSNQQKGSIVLISSDEEYNGLYGQQNIRQRADYRQSSPTRVPLQQIQSTQAPRTKEQSSKAPPVQTIRNYNKVNDDGSFTFGYEAADGSFKEETRGTDCVVRGKYGYVDPDGNKREFTYVSGNPCDPNAPDDSEEREREEEDASDENIPQNYPQRPVVRTQTVRPLPTTTSRPPTTVFQNTYAHSSLPQEQSEEEDDEPVQYVQRPRVSNRPYAQTTYAPAEQINVRPRQKINTTPSAPVNVHYQSSPQPVSITPRPSYRTSIQSIQTQPPATTYRPQLQIINKPAPQPSTPNSINAVSKGPIDFAAEFQKFQQQHNVQSTTSSTKPHKSSNQQQQQQQVTTNPIYESQLVYDPSTGQYDSALYQQLPQTDGDFSLSQRIPPYVQQIQQPQLVSLEQLQRASPLYNRPTAQPQQQQPVQFSQQVYQKQQENHQLLNSQQLFAQQQEQQQAQLQQDRIEAAKHRPNQAHRFQVQGQQAAQQTAQPQQPQSFYYIQPSGTSTGQIDAFLRGHNIDY